MPTSPTSLTSGAALVLPAAERSGDALAHLIRTQGVTHALLPPVVVADLPESLGLAGLLVGGESCAPDLVARWSRGRRMINAYGWPSPLHASRAFVAFQHRQETRKHGLRQNVASVLGEVDHIQDQRDPCASRAVSRLRARKAYSDNGE
jgi:non-ribosomal peptide synthetase component F